jgi:hypothetical protein
VAFGGPPKASLCIARLSRITARSTRPNHFLSIAIWQAKIFQTLGYKWLRRRFVVLLCSEPENG